MSTERAPANDRAGLPAVANDLGPVLQLPNHLAAHLPTLPTSMQFQLDPHGFQQIQRMAVEMSKARGIVPDHLVGSPSTCFAIIMNCIDWKLPIYRVAQATFPLPGNRVGYMGSLVQSIIELSGALDGEPERIYFGDWTKIVGKFDKRKNNDGKEYCFPTWTAQEVMKEGLGIAIRAKIRGESKPRIWPGENEPFFLAQAFPLFSTMWATDPKTQLGYLGMRRFASLAVPHLLMGATFDVDPMAPVSVEPTPQLPAAEAAPKDTNGAEKLRTFVKTRTATEAKPTIVDDKPASTEEKPATAPTPETSPEAPAAASEPTSTGADVGASPPTGPVGAGGDEEVDEPAPPAREQFYIVNLPGKDPRKFKSVASALKVVEFGAKEAAEAGKDAGWLVEFKQRNGALLTVAPGAMDTATSAFNAAIKPGE